jgi:hypothetical protein
MPDVIRTGRWEAPARHRVTTLTAPPPQATASCRFPGAGIAPVSRRPRNAISAIAALRGTAGCRCSANKVPAVSAEPAGGRTPAIYARKNLRVPSARTPPEAIARTVCQYTGVSWSPGIAGRLPAANPLSAVVTRRSRRLSCWLGEARHTSKATHRRRDARSRGNSWIAQVHMSRMMLTLPS